MLALVVSNLLYPVIAVGVAIVVCVAIALTHRRPKSTEANMKAFHKGLRALAPGTEETKRGRRQPPRVANRLDTALPSSYRRRVEVNSSNTPTNEGAEAETG